VRKKQGIVQRNTCDKNFGLDFNCKDAIDFKSNFSNFSINYGAGSISSFNTPELFEKLRVLLLIYYLYWRVL